MARKATPEKPTTDPRSAVVDALIALAAEKPWRDISLVDIATRAELSLADLRDLFPSKGAMLGGFIRRIDHITLDSAPMDADDQPAHDRVLDLMMRRFDALHPYRAALKSVQRGFAADLAGLFALNTQALNSWRYLLESVGIETDGPLGVMRVQGAILVFARVFPTFLGEEDASLTRTMAALDRELQRGEWALRRAEGLHRILAPLRGFCRAAREARRARTHARDAEDSAASAAL